MRHGMNQTNPIAFTASTVTALTASFPPVCLLIQRWWRVLATGWVLL